MLCGLCVDLPRGLKPAWLWWFNGTAEELAEKGDGES
jgi:hypothetical protein